MNIYDLHSIFFEWRVPLKCIIVTLMLSTYAAFHFYYYFYSDFIAVCMHFKALKFSGALMQSRDGVICYKELSVWEKIQWLSDRKRLVYFEHQKAWDSWLFIRFWWVSLQELIVICPWCDSPKRHWKWKEEVQKSIEICKTKWYYISWLKMYFEGDLTHAADLFQSLIVIKY